jgi:hypothetical protein
MGKLKKATGIDIAAPVKAVQNVVSSVGNATGISPALTKVFQPVEKAVVQPVGQGLASLDKAVGKAIPGGWGTIAQVAGSAMGVPTPYMVGLGALQGSGVTRKGGSFNLQGALIGGATAYATAKLGDYMRAAAPGAEAIPGVTPAPTVDAAGNIINQATGQVGSGLAGNASGLIADPSLLTSANVAQLNALSAPLEAGAGIGLQVAPPPSIMSQIMGGNFGDALSQAGTNISNATSNAFTGAGEGISSLGTKASDAFKAATDLDTYSGAIDRGLSNASQTGAGIKNLITGPAGVSKAASALSGVNPVNMGGMALYGSMSLADLDAQRDFLKQQQASGNIAQAEYDAAMAEIDRSVAVARDAVAKNPFNSNPDRSATMGDTDYRRASSDENLYDRFRSNQTLYAKGGEVEHFFLGGLSGRIANILRNKPADNQASGAGFQSLRSEGMPSSQSGGSGGGGIFGSVASAMPEQIPVGTGFQKLRSEGIPSPQVSSGGGFGMGRGGFGFGLGALANAVGASNRFSNTPISLGINLYDKRSDKNRLYEDMMNKNYAMGGSIDDEYGMDEARGMMQGNLQKGLFGQGYASGGQPRFLSGGGDGMSDSIKASINGTQEARLADGEFVIPADVVSHLGNGSSKAGAKRLYSMMDKVRSARTGTKRQGKQINPKQFMPV